MSDKVLPIADIPMGYELVEVGAYASSNDWPRTLLTWDKVSNSWWNKQPYGAFARGDHPLESKLCAWERIYVLRKKDE